MSVEKRIVNGKVKYAVRVYTGVVNGKKKYIFESFDKKSQADARERELNNFKSNNVDISVSDKVLFSSVAAAYLKNISKTRKDNTVRSYKSKIETWINPKIGMIQIGNIRHLTISRFFDEIKTEGASESTLYIVGVVLNEIMEFSCNSIERYIIENPMRSFSRPEKQEKSLSPDEYWTFKEANAFLKEAKKTEYFNTFVFALGTGPRFGELASLDPSCFDFNSSIVTFGQQLSKYDARSGEESFKESVYFLDTTKSNKARPVPMNDFVAQKAEEEINKSGGNFFIFAPGDTTEKTVLVKRGSKPKTIKAKHMTNRTFAYVMKRICSSAGVKYIGPHGLRHTFAVH